MKTMKACFSVLIGLLLTASVASAQVEMPQSAVAECVEIVLPNYYQPGITPIHLMKIVEGECGDVLLQEMSENGMDPNDSALVLAGIFYYTTEWLNRNLQDVLNYMAEGCPDVSTQQSVEI
jgi:hypothetical protein